MNRRTIALDLDGVFADFFPYAKRVFGADYRSSDPAAFWEKASSIPHLFSNLEPIPGSLALLEALSGHNIYVLTAIPRPTGLLVSAAADKRSWVAAHLSPGLHVETVIGGPNKGRYAQPGHILIDDTERNVLAWEAAGGTGILHRNVAETIEICRSLGIISPEDSPSAPKL